MCDILLGISGRGGSLLMAIHDLSFLSPRAGFPPHFLKIVVEVKASGPPHVLTLWLGYVRTCPNTVVGVCKDMS